VLRQRLGGISIAACLAVAGLQPVLGRPMPPQNTQPAPATARSADGLQLKVRRLPDAVELVLEDAGLGATLTQQPFADRWQGELRTDRQRALRLGPQSVALPAEGLERISFDGSGSNFRLSVTPTPGSVLGSPVISSDGRDLVVRFPAPQQFQTQTVRPNLTRPTPVPTDSYVPPLRPRAVAPPVGDMAVGTMTLQNRGYLNLSGPPVTLTTRGANPRDVLMVLAQMGGYGFAYSDLQPQRFKQGTDLAPEEPQKEDSKKGAPTVTVSFQNEPFARAFNFVLMAAGLQARREGNIILAGPSILQQPIGSQVSKVYRLNQASAASAADYLANLGTLVTATFSETITATTGVPLAGASTANPQTTRTSTETKVLQYGGERGPLLGLLATTDNRLGTITLVGESALVVVAEQYLRQLDLRQRQVSLSVKILDVTLNNDSEIDNSFAFRFGNNFIVNDSGQLLAAFGSRLPPERTAFNRSIPEDIKAEVDENGKVEITAPAGVDVNSIYRLIGNTNSRSDSSDVKITTTQKSDPSTGLTTITISGDSASTRNILSMLSNRSGDTIVGGVTGGTRQNPGQNYSDQQFYDFLRAQIVSSNTKVLAAPTLILQEGGQSYGGSDARRISEDGQIGRSRTNEAFVRVGTQLITAFEVKQDAIGNAFCQPLFGNAGLTFGARVDKIDDNGFVTFSLSPEVSAAVGRQSAGSCGEINIINDRLLDTGQLRVRDGQTLILTGVISQTDRQIVSKWPILGDMPLIGQFFRASSGSKTKNELVIMVTPRVIEDDSGGSYGYGYSPATTDAKQMIYGGN
jgi:type IV pilus assembly protein PilQ